MKPLSYIYVTRAVKKPALQTLTWVPRFLYLASPPKYSVFISGFKFHLTTLFNTYVEELIREWKLKLRTGIFVNVYHTVHRYIPTIRWLLRTVMMTCKTSCFENLYEEWEHDHLTWKTNLMALIRKRAVESKIVTDDQVLEKNCSKFQYSGCDVFPLWANMAGHLLSFTVFIVP